MVEKNGCVSAACPPYDGAKEMLPVTIIDDRELLQKMVLEMFSELPKRKPNAKKSGKGSDVKQPHIRKTTLPEIKSDRVLS